MDYKIIETGSHGNAVILNNCILIDCGVPFCKIKEYYKKLKIVFLTHIHSDHFKKATIKKLALERPTIRFACCEWLLEPLVECGVRKSKIDILHPGQRYDYKSFFVSPIKLYHDVPNCGYRFLVNGEKAIYATDTAHLDGISAKNYDLYMLEANYGEDELKQRIEEKKMAGEYSYEMFLTLRHMSKEYASNWLMENMGEKSQYVFLHMHKDKKNETVEIEDGQEPSVPNTCTG